MDNTVTSEEPAKKRGALTAPRSEGPGTPGLPAQGDGGTGPIAPRPIRFGARFGEQRAADAALGTFLGRVAASVGDVPALLDLARDAGKEWPQPGQGSTGVLWEHLASVAAVDVAAARIFEPHLDAVAILAQSGNGPGPVQGAWGVFAAEGPGTRLEAKAGDAGILLGGSKPWCSLASLLDHAVITAHTESGGRAAFAVDLRHPGVTCEEPVWVARGLREIPSGTVNFSQVPAELLVGEDWYFSRPGFAWGGMGVAACWLGGAVGVARDYRNSLAAAAEAGREPDQVALAALGKADRIITATLQYLARAASTIDGAAAGDKQDSLEHGGRTAGQHKPGTAPSAWSDALRVRGTVAAAVERVLSLVTSNRGPAPLAFEEPYAKRLADLALYVRQHHGMRDDAQLGKLTLTGDSLW